MKFHQTKSLPDNREPEKALNMFIAYVLTVLQRNHLEVETTTFGASESGSDRLFGTKCRVALDPMGLPNVTAPNAIETLHLTASPIELQVVAWFEFVIPWGGGASNSVTSNC